MRLLLWEEVQGKCRSPFSDIGLCCLLLSWHGVVEISKLLGLPCLETLVLIRIAAASAYYQQGRRILRFEEAQLNRYPGRSCR